MTTYAVTYCLGAAITVVVEAADKDAAAILAQPIADDRLAEADAVLAEFALAVEMYGPADLADVDEVTP
jgi:hypothetical protein